MFNERWDQRNAQGQQGPPGEYEMVAVFPPGGAGFVRNRPDGPKVRFSVISRSVPSAPQHIASMTNRKITLNGSIMGEVLLDSQVILRIREVGGGFSAIQRAEVIAARLQKFLRLGLRPEDLAIESVGSETTVTWRRQVVVQRI